MSREPNRAAQHVPPAAVWHPDDAALRTQVLRPYRDSARYLKSAEVHASAGEVAVIGEFSIGQSCYIDDTGHFNAVEFNICYNQAAYYLFAKAVQERLVDSFAPWSLDDFWQQELATMLICRFESRFRRMLDSRSFGGEVRIAEPVIRERPGKEPVMFVDMTVRFWYGDGDACDGLVTAAVTNLPRA